MWDVEIDLPTGPELVTGSTRLKAGTATKLALNILSTCAMVRLGKVRGNLMIDVNASNLKLRDRAIRIVSELRGCGYEEARSRLGIGLERAQCAVIERVDAAPAVVMLYRRSYETLCLGNRVLQWKPVGQAGGDGCGWYSRCRAWRRPAPAQNGTRILFHPREKEIDRLISAEVTAFQQPRASVLRDECRAGMSHVIKGPHGLACQHCGLIRRDQRGAREKPLPVKLDRFHAQQTVAARRDHDGINHQWLRDCIQLVALGLHDFRGGLSPRFHRGDGRGGTREPDLLRNSGRGGGVDGTHLSRPRRPRR